MNPYNPPMEELFTIQPLFARSNFSKFLVMKRTELKLVEKTLLSFSSVIFSNASVIQTPALLNKISIPVYLFSTNFQRL